MKECWINVYLYPLTGIFWYGAYHEQKFKSDLVTKYRIYRIHVRLK